MDILETGENSISQGSEGPPWRKLKYNGESVPLHRWRSASAKKKSKWNVPTQGIAQLDFMAENFYILEPKVRHYMLRDDIEPHQQIKPYAGTRIRLKGSTTLGFVVKNA